VGLGWCVSSLSFFLLPSFCFFFLVGVVAVFVFFFFVSVVFGFFFVILSSGASADGFARRSVGGKRLFLFAFISCIFFFYAP